VIHLRFGVADLGLVRFAFCPAWEAVISLRTLATASLNGLYGPWLRQVQPKLTEVADLELLQALVRPTGYLPDFLHPIPTRQVSGFDAGIASVAAADPAVVAAELAQLAQHRIAQQGPGRARRQTLLTELAASPEAALVRITAALRGYWRAAIAPHWPRLRAVLDADLAYRLSALATGGVRELFRTLHPAVSFDGRDTLHIVKYYEGTAELGNRGLLLIPCVFAWPDVIVRTADPQPTVSYTPRGVGRLWESRTAEPDGSPLAGVLGNTRAAILAQLDLPMSTTHLASQLELAAPTVNVHLKALHQAGIVSSRRDGRSVVYERTQLGDLLLTGHAS
jgi:DNA-binding transcriptional ArsR family regulator